MTTKTGSRQTEDGRFGIAAIHSILLLFRTLFATSLIPFAIPSDQIDSERLWVWETFRKPKHATKG